MRALRLGTLGWLGLFGIDALLSLLVPSALSVLTTLALAASTPVAVLAMVATPRVPARLVLPPVVFLGWVTLGALPVTVLTFGTPWTGPIVALLQLGVLTGVAGMAHRLGPFEQRPAWAWRRSLALLVGLALGTPTAAGAYAWGSGAWLLHRITDGYAGLDLHGLYLTERTYERDGTVVHLVGMMHVGEQRRYEELYADFGELPDAVVLTEGVTDEQHLLSSRTGYDKLAGRLDLVQQPSLEGRDLHVRRTDIDISEVSDDTRRLLDDALSVWGADDPGMAYVSLVTSLEDDDPEALIRTLRHDLLDLRNQKVLEGIAAADGEFAHIVVPWGALHLPGISAALVDDGFAMSGQSKRPLLGYAAILRGLAR